MKRTRYLVLSVAILFLAIILRTVFLSIIPNGLHVDELDAGYIGRYIIEHGKDIIGTYFPLYYNKFGDYRPTGIFYLSGLSVKLFGPTIAAIRLPGALLGSLTVLSVMGFSYLLFGNILGAFLSGFFLAILPWHIVLSRATSEGIIGLFFFVTGLALFLYGCQRNIIRFLLYGAIGIGIGYLFYHPFRLVAPVLLLPFLIYPMRKKELKSYIRGIVSFFFILTILLSISGSGNGRLSQVVFFANPSLNNKSNEIVASEGKNNIIQARIFHNKIVIMTREFIIQYFKYFSSDFLFINGGLPDRYKIPEQGLLYITFLPFIIVGFIGLIKDRKKWQVLFITWLLLVSPLPAALTYEDTPNIHRSLIMIIPFILLAEYGAMTVYTFFQSKRFRYIFIGLSGVILLIEISYFIHQYGIHAKSYKSFFRNDRYLELAQYLIKNNTPYSRIYVPGYEHFPLYVLFMENNFQFQEFSKDSNDVLLPTYKNIEFMHTWCPSKIMEKEDISKNNLLIDRDDCLTNGNYHEVSALVRKDATTAFRMLIKNE